MSDVKPPKDKWIIRKSHTYGCDQVVYNPKRDIVYHAFDEGEADGLRNVLNRMQKEIRALKRENRKLRKNAANTPTAENADTTADAEAVATKAGKTNRLKT